MAEKNKSGFHTVGDTDMEEYTDSVKQQAEEIIDKNIIVFHIIH